jgi:hypothetical protein
MPMKRQMSDHILPASSTMVGVCLMTVSIVRVMEASAKVTTVIDNILAIDSLVFLASTVLSYVSLRRERDLRWLERLADLVFLVGLLLIVLASFMLAWEVGHYPVPQPALPAA